MVLNIGLTYNLAREVPKGSPKDLYAEFDSDSTVQAIRKSLESGGHKVTLIEANEDAYGKLKSLRPDMVFNIAEGLRGESRESHIAAMLEMLGIPYTASGPLTLAITLDKARTKEILIAHKIPTPMFAVYTEPPKKDDKFDLPAIVKPISEGSSKGIREDSVVETQEQFRRVVASRIKEYKQPVLVEKFVGGREFTVAIMGNKQLNILPLIEINFEDLPKESKRIDSYEAKWIWDDPSNPLDCIICPAKIDKKQEAVITKVAVDTYDALGCRDWTRIDIRLDEMGVPNVLDVNALPGMIHDPKANSRFPAAARAAGMKYEEVILTVLGHALERCGMK